MVVACCGRWCGGTATWYFLGAAELAVELLPCRKRGGHRGLRSGRRRSGLDAGTIEARYVGNLERLLYVSYGVRGFGNFGISRLTSLQELHDYQVGGKICNKISAIGNFRDLRELSVGGLHNVKSYEEAKDAKLKEKQLLNSLYLDWSTPDQIMTDDLVLDHLEPHVNIRKLLIRGYDGPKIPSWIENRSVKNLVSLRLYHCINWEYLPSLGELVLLKLVMLFNLPKLRQIGRSSDMSSSSSMELSLPQSLHTLEVTECQKLRELPILPASLVSLQIRDVGLTKLPMIGKISSQGIESKSSNLTEIRVSDCPYLTSLEGSLLDQDCLRSLRKMHIEGCENLSSLGGLGSLPSLLRLKITGCSKIEEAAGSLLTRVASGSGGEEEHLAEPSSSLQITSLDIGPTEHA